MNKRFSILTTIVIIWVGLLPAQLYAQTQLIKNPQAGKPQVLVVYGTSLSAATGGQAWVKAVADSLNKKYNGNLKVYNSGKSAMWSTWGVQHLEDSVITKKPDAVLMEFSMNDAFLNYQTSVPLARLNLNYIIDRIKLLNPGCEIFLQIMNIPVNVHAQQRPLLNQYYALYREVAKKRKLLLIDHYPHWKTILDKGKDEYLKFVPDGIHPAPESARQIIAPFVIQKLEGNY